MASMTHALNRTALLALIVSASACSSTLDLEVKLVTDSCDALLDPMSDGTNTATQLRFSVTGDGIEPSRFLTKLSAGQGELTLPEIPIGRNVNLRVEALLATDALVAMGQTGPMDLTDKEGSYKVAVFLRRIDAFTRTTSTEPSAGCTGLGIGRAGHTATLLSDGRVLIAGGYHDDGKFAVKVTEIYDPRTGKVETGPIMNQPRAFHTATRIPGTKLILFAGGEYHKETGKPMAAVENAEVLDEDAPILAFTVAKMKTARTRHAAAVPPAAGLLALIGGYGADGGPLSSVEIFDHRKWGTGADPFTELPIDLGKRAELSALGIGAGFILIAGGYDGDQLLKSTTLLQAPITDPGAYAVVQDWNAELGTARALPLLAAFNNNEVIVTGGFTSPPLGGNRIGAGTSDATNATEFIKLNIGKPIPVEVKPVDDASLTDDRGYGGIVALGDGRLLVGGGAFRSGGAVFTGTAEILAPGGEGVSMTPIAAQLLEHRYQSTWTLLQDGTVLVAGGMQFTSGGKMDFLKSLEIFQPVVR